MRRLAGATELLDGPLDRRVLADNLRDLARLNRFLGGADLSWRALEPILRRRTISGCSTRLLDVGTGAADIPRELLRRARRDDFWLEIVATDIRPEILTSARLQAGAEANLELRLAQAGEVAGTDGAYDVVHSSLLLHHFEPRQATVLLSEMRRAASRAVIVNDVRRGRRWWLGAWLLSRLVTGNRYTRHDGPLSVRRAYTADEVSALGAAAGLREAARHRHALGYRYAVVFTRHAQSE